MSLIRFLAAATLLGATGAALAATPASGVLTPSSGPITYTVGPFVSANPTPVPLVEVGPTCEDPLPQCDHFDLTVSLPAGYVAGHGADFVKVTVAWTDTGTGSSDYDLWIYRGQVSSTDGSMQPPFSGDGGANPEIAQIYPLEDGDTQFTIKVVPYTPTGETVDVTVELVSGAPGGVLFTPGFGEADAPVANGPRYQTLSPPDGIGAEAGNGECNIGFNPLTSKIMFMCFGNGSVFRLTAPEKLAEPLPESCEAQWEDVTPIATSGPQPVADPILFTDAVSGRTWASNLTAGPNVSYAFTDDDGDTWVEAGAGGIAGADHQTIGSGPYPADFALPHPLHENAVYFCSQAVAGPAGCIRSDDGGITWGPTYLAYDGSVCGGLHGHVRVSPKDGSVWLPVETCGSGTGMAISEDAGETWRDFVLPPSEGMGTLGSDPTVSLDEEGTAYFCYADGDGKMKASVSRDNGATWSDPVDIGAQHGIRNSSFPQSWAGSAGRAACGFMGTDRQGNLQSLDFPGLWYMYIAHTYDGGQTWTTVNVTPNDPVQGIGGVWHGGGSNANRNLLDFNEATADDQGRFLLGYDDGCVRDCAKNPLANPQSFTALMKVARQTGGRTLNAAFDRPEPRAPGNPCLSGKRTQRAAALQWREPDHGGAAITGYKVFRSTTPDGVGEFVGQAGAKTGYLDNSADPNVEQYYYTVTAVNGAGESVASNKIALPVVEEVIESLCVLPGVTLFSDASNDFDTALVGANGMPYHDLLLLQVAQPKSEDGVTRLVFSLKVGSLAAPLPPSTDWFVSFEAPNGELRGVRMSTDQGVPRFFSYLVGASNGGLTDGRFVDAEGPIEAESHYTEDGIITFVVKATDVGGAGLPGEQFKNFNAGSVQVLGAAGAGAADAMDGMPDGLARAGRVDIVPNGQCPAEPVPQAGGAVGVVAQEDTERFGGALNLLALLGLALLGAARLRRRG